MADLGFLCSALSLEYSVLVRERSVGKIELAVISASMRWAILSELTVSLNYSIALIPSDSKPEFKF